MSISPPRHKFRWHGGTTQYDSLERIQTMKRFKTLLLSKTVWSGIGLAATAIAAAPEITTLVLVKAAATALGGVGIRDAIEGLKK